MRVLLCSYFKFPEGDAGAIRHEKLAYMLQALGHEVYVVGLGAHCGFETERFRGIAYTSLRENDSNFKGKVLSRLRYWGRLKKIMRTYQPEIVLMDDMRPSVTVKLKGFCRTHGIRLVHDSVEWYSPVQFRFGPLALPCIQKNILNRYLVDRSMQVISISSYLHMHYSGKGIRSVIIPIMLADRDFCREKNLGENVQFMYAGQPGKKDNLHVIVDAFSLLAGDADKKFKLHIVGCTREQLLASDISADKLQKLGARVMIHGRIPHSKVLDLLKEIDFTLLLRSPTQRYAKAGFPTKATESLSRSTPMICNLTSDLGLYLTDTYNALLVSRYDAEGLAEVLQKAIELPLEVRAEMCEHAHLTASTKLHYRCFMEKMKSILQ